MSAGAEPPGLQRRPMVDEFDGRGASLEGDFPESGPTGPVELPPAELGNLPEIAQVLHSGNQRVRFRVRIWVQVMVRAELGNLLEIVQLLHSGNQRVRVRVWVQVGLGRSWAACRRSPRCRHFRLSSPNRSSASQLGNACWSVKQH